MKGPYKVEQFKGDPLIVGPGTHWLWHEPTTAEALICLNGAYDEGRASMESEVSRLSARVKELEQSDVRLGLNVAIEARDRANDNSQRFAARVKVLEEALNRLGSGCQAHGCKIKKPSGWATNGPCQCLDTLRSVLAALSTRAGEGGA